MQKFYFEEHTSSLRNITGYTLFSLGFLLFFIWHPIFLIPAFLGIKLIIKKGTALEINTQTYKHYKKIFGVRLGSWKEIPTPKYITITTASETERTTIVTASTSQKNHFYRINLFYSDTEHIKIYRTDNKDEAYKTLFKLSKILNTDVYDGLQQDWL